MDKIFDITTKTEGFITVTPLRYNKKDKVKIEKDNEIYYYDVND